MRPTRTTRRAPRGYVIAETLTASVILAVCLGTVFNVIIEGRRIIQDANRRAQAMRIAQSITERERNKDFDVLAAVARAPVPGYTNVQSEVRVTTRLMNDGGFSYVVKDVETVIYYVYRGKPTELHVNLLRSP